MRLFPVVGSGTTRRSLEQDMWIGEGKLLLPKGVLLWIPAHAVQNVAANWDQPDQFQPERWSQVSIGKTNTAKTENTDPSTTADRRLRIASIENEA